MKNFQPGQKLVKLRTAPAGTVYGDLLQREARLPDPAGCDSLGPAVLLGLGQGVCGGGAVVVLHHVPVARHEVAPESVEVLQGDGQEELHAEDVQQRLEGRDKRSGPVWELRGGACVLLPVSAAQDELSGTLADMS